MSPPRRVFVLTGAGISAESGLGTFRGDGGLWGRFDPVRLATPEAFAAEPDAVHAFYNLRRRGVVAARPNPAHHAMVRLERGLSARGGRLFLCTQNVDDLHERAGAAGVVHMHGELLRARCGACGHVFACRGDLATSRACPACGGRGALRPDVVWFGERPMHLDAIDAALRAAELFVAVGTSGAVYPAAGFVAQARALGIPTCEINLGPADNGALFDQAHHGPAGERVPAFVDALLG